MGSCRRVVEYEEEDGWEFKRGEATYLAYAKGEASVVWYYEPATRDDPGGEGVEVEDYNIYDIEIGDENGDIVPLELTEQEKEDFESYMHSRLDDAIDAYDEWDEWDGPDYDPEKDV